MKQKLSSLLAVAALAFPNWILFDARAGTAPTEKEFANSIGMKFVRIESGTFTMGSDGNELPEFSLSGKEHGSNREIWLPKKGDYDEFPAHPVTISKAFYMGVYEVTNRQYEEFDKLHAHLRGKRGYSVEHDESVVFVDWFEAKAFCDWLSEKEGLPYRLPTEAEWEYACRAGTSSVYWNGDSLPDGILKNPDNSWFPEPVRSRGRAEIVPVHVGQNQPNPWGLFDMHGNVEEWCYDWYGPYVAGDHSDPVGRIDGDFKVSRGGSHSTISFYLRSANRMGTLPESRSWYTGFRVVLGEMPDSRPEPPTKPERYQINVRQNTPPQVFESPDPDQPYFAGPRPYVIIPNGAEGPLYENHNHDPDIAECPNGDLLAIWYTTVSERGRELAMAASRLRFGEKEWEPASPFFDAPDRNDHAPALWYDGKQSLYHFNGLSVAATWGPMAIIMRISTDSGVTWSKPRMIAPEYQGRNQVVPSEFRTNEGYLVLPCDATPSGTGGTAIHISKDNGATWHDPGGTIGGIHAGVTQLQDGSLIAFGRGDNIEGQMPKSISKDMGKTWIRTPSGFPPVGSGQRCVLMRLQQGPLLLGTIANGNPPVYVQHTPGVRREIRGFFCALSYDGGQTWPHLRVLSDDAPPRKVPTTDASQGRSFTMSKSQGEPRGYFAVTQARNGVIHLISSWNHYAFNLKWLQTSPPPTE